MTLLAALGLGLLIGLVLGALGGGGAILTIPALVYLLGQTAQGATTSSLVIVGLSAVVGVLAHIKTGDVRWRTGIAFGAAGILAALAGSVLNRQVDQHVLLVGFAAVMAVAAAGMLRQQGGKADDETEGAETDGSEAETDANSNAGSEASRVDGSAGLTTRTSPRVAQLERHHITAGAPCTTTRTSESAVRRESKRLLSAMPPRVLAAGLAAGFLTGFFGVGGGFVIVPALVLALGLPMQTAVGTSLLVVAINSATSLAARAGSTHFDWELIVPFTLAAMAATTVGKRVADRLPNRTLGRGFAVLLLVVAAYTGVHSAIQLVNPDTATAAQPSAAPQIAPAAAAQLIAAGEVTVIDVRTPQEFNAGHIRGAINIDFAADAFTDQVNVELVNSERYLAYCQSGNRSSAASAAIRQLGYDVVDAGALTDLEHAGAPVQAGP